ncbi:hypothetical protein PAXRUDRAFT_156417 [Paxillus rubicundulus Ve08.2h10]|uniref:Uncharacterized protein n=1 Tax=Paxillus rubicundulus Ve08.2h10 TaxID=930991 RepID=A0A0D0DB52_9AGAM|nr:hypothetical protein PAXRUDRAFT_156417 [Paxillus rubicundulus Ve08.2h10]
MATLISLPCTASQPHSRTPQNLSFAIVFLPVALTYPDNIMKTMYHESGKPAKAFNCLFCGPLGISHHIHNHCHYIGTLNGNADAVPGPSSQAASHSQATSSSQHTSGKALTHTEKGKGSRRWPLVVVDQVCI